MRGLVNHPLTTALAGLVAGLIILLNIALVALTGLAAVFTAAMSLIRDDPRYLAPGLALLAATAACSDLASVPYNTMLRQLSTPQTAGRVSALGWAAGYAGSVVLLQGFNHRLGRVVVTAKFE
jgi:UMF1 family MFS transporter